MTTALPRMYTLQEIADEYGFSLRMLEIRARQKQFRHVRIGKVRRLTQEHLDELLAGSTVQPDRPTAKPAPAVGRPRGRKTSAVRAASTATTPSARVA